MNKVTIGLVAGTLLGFFIGTSMMLVISWLPRESKSMQLVKEYGYLETLAYENAIKLCEKEEVAGEVCQNLMIQNVSLYQEEYGTGSYFIISNTRKPAPNSFVVAVQVSLGGEIKDMRKEDPEVLNNLPLK